MVSILHKTLQIVKRRASGKVEERRKERLNGLANIKHTKHFGSVSNVSESYFLTHNNDIGEHLMFAFLFLPKDPCISESYGQSES
mgnify:CR=1 FL=1